MSHISEFAKAPENFKGLQQDRIILDVASLIYRTMRARGISRSRLAELLGVTKGRVTQYLGGERNLTLRTLADIFTAMDTTLSVRAIDISEMDRVYEVPARGLLHTTRKSNMWGGLDRVAQDLDITPLAA